MTAPLIAALCALAIGAGSEIIAGSIINKDAKKYTLDVTCDGTTMHPTIGPKSTLTDAVSKGCAIKLSKDAPSYSVRGDNGVVIADGKISEP